MASIAVITNDIQQAVRWWEKGVVATRRAWGENNHLCKVDHNFTRRDSVTKRLYPLRTEDIIADDWELAR